MSIFNDCTKNQSEYNREYHTVDYLILIDYLNFLNNLFRLNDPP